MMLQAPAFLFHVTISSEMTRISESAETEKNVKGFCEHL